MSKLEDQIRRSLHGAAERLPESPASQPLDSGRPEKPRGRWSGPMVALLAMAVVLVVLGGVALLQVGTDRDQPPAGTVESVNLEEFEAGVMAGFEALFDAPGFEAVQVKSFDTGEVERSWLDYRTSPDEGTDPASWVFYGVLVVGDDYHAAATAMVDGFYFTARFASPLIASDTIWSEGEGPASLLSALPLQVVTAYPFSSLDEYSYFFGVVHEDFTADATHQTTSDGASRWTVTYTSSLETTVTEHWDVHPDGHLRSHTFERSGPGLSMGVDARHRGSQPVAASVDFTPLSGPDPHLPPEVGSALDLTEFGVPSDFPGQEITDPDAARVLFLPTVVPEGFVLREGWLSDPRVWYTTDTGNRLWVPSDGAFAVVDRQNYGIRSALSPHQDLDAMLDSLPEAVEVEIEGRRAVLWETSFNQEGVEVPHLFLAVADGGRQFEVITLGMSPEQAIHIAEGVQRVGPDEIEDLRATLPWTHRATVSHDGFTYQVPQEVHDVADDYHVMLGVQLLAPRLSRVGVEGFDPERGMTGETFGQILIRARTDLTPQEVDDALKDNPTIFGVVGFPTPGQ